MQKYGSLVIVSIASSLLSIFLYKQFDGSKPVFNYSDGEARYTKLVDKLLSGRSQGYFQSSAPTDFTTAAQVGTPAVVNIKALQTSASNIFGNSSVTGSSGSGVILSPDGFIATNHHVIENSTDIKVTLADKREYRAKLVGEDNSTDIALLKIDEEELPFMVFGNSDSVRVGEWVMAVGNPFNLESTVTAGIVSAKGRNINILRGGSSIESFIQTDAAVNPGNSGGALINTNGELIGINTAIITESGSYEGYSFAVPSNLVQKIIRDLREFGFVQRAFLGIGIQDVDNDIAAELGLERVEGAYINSIRENGAASEAGLATGDVITGLNGVPIMSTPELQEMIGRFRPGDRIAMEYWRDGKKFKTNLTLKDVNNMATTARVSGTELETKLGFAMRDLSKDEKRRIKLQGALVTSIKRNSVVWETNMQPGFIISSVNGTRIYNIAEAITAISNARNAISLDGYYEGEPDLYSYRFKKAG